MASRQLSAAEALIEFFRSFFDDEGSKFALDLMQHYVSGGGKPFVRGERGTIDLLGWRPFMASSKLYLSLATESPMKPLRRWDLEKNPISLSILKCPGMSIWRYTDYETTHLRGWPPSKQFWSSQSAPSRKNYHLVQNTKGLFISLAVILVVLLK